MMEDDSDPIVPGRCFKCGDSTGITSYECLGCERECSKYIEDRACKKEDGLWYVTETDERMRHSQQVLIRCEHCGSTNLEVSLSTYCGC